MGGLWDTINAGKKPAIDVANGDVQEVYDPPRGAPIRVERDNTLKFKPVEAQVKEDPNIDLVTEDAPTYVFKAQSSEVDPRSIQRIGGRSKLAREIAKNSGRPRLYKTGAERQKAFRERQKALRGPKTKK